MKDWPTASEMLVMRILQDEPRGLYGLQVVEHSDGVVKRGSVYVLLGRLEEKGFVRVIRPKAETGLPGMPRPIYQLTGQGSKVLAAAETIGLSFSGARQ